MQKWNPFHASGIIISCTISPLLACLVTPSKLPDLWSVASPYRKYTCCFPSHIGFCGRVPSYTLHQLVQHGKPNSRHPAPVSVCHTAESTQDRFQNKSKHRIWIRDGLEISRKKCSHVKMGQCYVVMVKRADWAVRWASVRIPTLPLTAERPGTSPNLFELIKNALRSPLAPEITSHPFHDCQGPAGSGSSATLPLSLLFSLIGLGSGPWMLHALSHERSSAGATSSARNKPPLPLYSCPLHLLSTSVTPILISDLSVNVIPPGKVFLILPPHPHN